MFKGFVFIMVCGIIYNSRREQFLQWIEKLADTQTPSWLGLPNNAEMVLLTNKGRISICPLKMGWNID